MMPRVGRAGTCICELPSAEGTCFSRWFYDGASCKHFWYRGCGGNDNNFETEEECHRECPGDISEGKCELPSAEGACQSNLTLRWFYDGASCKQFWYRGCGGNDNNFATEEECHQECPGDISEDDNLIRKIRRNVTATSSRHWRDWIAERAIDFNDSSKSESCECCSGSNGRPAWWRVDLGARYPIDEIMFIGRSDGGPAHYQSRKFSMYDGFKDIYQGQTLIYRNNATRGHKFLITFQPQLILQHVVINSSTELTVCEIKFKESERCPPGYFGKHCMEYCHCKDSLSCARSTGVCQRPECLPGWQGGSCNKACDWGSYGDGCARNCHCLNNAKCESVSGNCFNEACAPGWKGLPTCSEECDWGSFGDNCAQYCHCYQNASCSNSNGTCSNGACASGWTTHSCSEECRPGTFGLDCRSFCHCANDRECNRFNGSCADNICDPGWRGNNCSIVCLPGTFGLDCKSICHCANEVECNHVNGSCADDVCGPGWRGNNCSIECDEGYFGQNCTHICHCRDNGKCSTVDGTCESGLCSAGWRKASCSDACLPGTFGLDCKSICHCANEVECNHVNGSCADDVCEPGWRGNNCSIECDEGYFGQNCTQICHCRDNGKCNTVDGTCESGLCSAGWRKASCSDVCLPGTFGLDCKSICHCANEVECNHVNGSCADDVCEPGWRGNNCSIAVQSATNWPQKAAPTGAVIGAVAGVIVVVCLIVVVVFWRRRKRHAGQKDAREQNGTQTREERLTDQAEPTKLFEERKNAITNLNSSIHGSTTRADENTYYDYDKEQKIPTYLLWDYLIEAYADKYEKMYQEFQQLPHGLKHDCTEARNPENARKNRYKDMYAYDHSRVILHRVDDTLSTYINACYIDGYNRKKKFIACQGPTKDMVDDFWQMIFQENISLIVMLTNVIEKGARKCIQYWAPTEDDELTFGDITVKTKRISTLPDYVMRELDVRKAGYASRCIAHAHFTAWPDKDVPDTPWHLVNFWRKIETMSSKGDKSIVIHCSAGVGRTGTYIALDILLAQANTAGFIQPYSVVENMRQQRVNMVQTKAQYVFLHEALAEALSISPSPIKLNEYAAVFESLLEDGTLGLKTGLEQQFQLVQDKMENTSTIEYCNFSSVRESDAFYANSPQESSLQSENSPRICYLQNYLKEDTVVLAQLSDAADSERLLKLIDEKTIRTVIGLQDLDQSDEHCLFDRKSRSRVKIEHIETRSGKVHDEKLFALKGQKSAKEEHRVKLFVYRVDATSSAVFVGTTHAIQLLNAVLKWQASFEDDKSVLITYGSSLGNAGILCLLLVEFERIRDREEVNLLETVKHMKQRNSMLLSDYEHYKFCHEAVMEYIRQSDVYINV